MDEVVRTVGADWLIDLADLTSATLIRQDERVTIYKAYWRTFQEVCVKKIKVDEENVRLIKREVEILSKCVHPKVCQYLGTGVQGQCVYILFEYMQRGNLQDFVYSNISALDNARKRDILTSVLIGMNYLSSRTPQKIIHRDFKPSNILVNKNGNVKIADFGVSKQLYNNRFLNRNTRASPTRPDSGSRHVLLLNYSNEVSDISHAGIGTLRWAAPELILDNQQTYDGTCDIYSFGLVAFFVVTDGAIPYYDEYKNNHAKIAYAKSKHIRPFLEHPRLVGKTTMLRMIAECTEKDPRLRPADANTILSRYFSDMTS